MSTRFVIAFAILAAVAAIAGTVPGQIAAGHVTLTSPATVAGTTLKAGDYRVTVFAGKATFTMGKQSQVVPAKVETGEQKYDTSKVQYEHLGAQTAVREIRLGGTKLRLIFN